MLSESREHTQVLPYTNRICPSKPDYDYFRDTAIRRFPRINGGIYSAVMLYITTNGISVRRENFLIRPTWSPTPNAQ